MRPGRMAIINLLGLLILIIIAGIAYYLWRQSYYFYSTDDAVVSGMTTNVAAATAGEVTAVRVTPNQTVTRGQPIVSLFAAPSGSSAGSGGGGSVPAGSNSTATGGSGESGGSVNATSPIPGTVLNVSAQPGQFAQPGQPLAQVADLSKSYITAYVDESHINDVHKGQGVDVKVDAYSGIQFHGIVTHIVPATASTFSLLPTNSYASGNFTKVTQRIPVMITLDGLQGKTLLPQTSASVTIHIHD